MSRTFTFCDDASESGHYFARIEVWRKGEVHWYSKDFISTDLRQAWIKDKTHALSIMPPK